MPRYTPVEILARQLCLQDQGRVIENWHPRAQPLWMDYLPDADRMMKAIKRGGYTIQERKGAA
jgi:hypothetical protein